MKFKQLKIKNFRNFQAVDLSLNNRNVIFGRNDFGKTNFLYALRFLFDRKQRQQGFAETDYYKRKTEIPIEITLSIELEEDDDSDFLRAEMKGETSFSDSHSSDEKIVYIQIKGEFNIKEQIGNPVLYWGGSLNEMRLIPQRGNFNDLDRIFEVVYVDPNVKPDVIYKKNKSLLYKEKDSSNHDEIKQAIQHLNDTISKNNRVIEISEDLTDKYRKIREEKIEIELKSELEINGTFNHLVPYIKEVCEEGEGIDDQLYPTSGDGRKKILSYALIRYLYELREERGTGKKIHIYLIEEVENSLHPTMQQAISRHLFKQKKGYDYIFVTTHSADMLLYMDNVELIRIYRENQSIKSKSNFYRVPVEFKETRKTFNRLLGRALFADRVLLVEGPSEQILFETVLEMLATEGIISYTSLEKGEILDVAGIGFEEYVNILKNVNITPIVKTDNDIKKVSEKDERHHVIGINRCVNLLPEDVILTLDEQYQRKNSEGDKIQIQPVVIGEKTIERMKKELYTVHQKVIQVFKQHSIFLSEIELEEDLKEALCSNQEWKSAEQFKGKFKRTPQGFVKYLQGAKKKRMNHFVNSDSFDIEVAKVIYDDSRFKCLKFLVGEDE